MRASPKRFHSERQVPDADGRHETANGHRTESYEAAVTIEPATERDESVRVVVELPAPGSAGVREQSTRQPTAVAEPVIGPAPVTPIEPTAEPTAERPAGEAPTIREPSVERPAVEPAVEDESRFPVRSLLYALPAVLLAIWAVAFVPAEIALVLGALAALPVAIVAIPWLVSVVVTAMLDRR